jgi:hypothetical protein
VVGVTGVIHRVQRVDPHRACVRVCSGFWVLGVLEEPVDYRVWKQTGGLARPVKAITAGFSLFFRLSSLKRDSLFNKFSTLVTVLSLIPTHPLCYCSEFSLG